jgi:hypothetical protein
MGDIYSVRPQGLCALCGAVLLNGKRPEKRIAVEFTHMRGDDEVYKAHSDCIKRFDNAKIIEILTKP